MGIVRGNCPWGKCPVVIALAGNCPGGNCMGLINLGRNSPRGYCPGGNLSRGKLSGEGIAQGAIRILEPFS